MNNTSYANIDKAGLPAGFLSELSGKLQEAVQEVIAAYLVPLEVIQALDTAIYLQILSGEKPEEHKPEGAAGYDRDTWAAAHDSAWLLESLGKLQAERVQSLGEADLKAAQELAAAYPVSAN